MSKTRQAAFLNSTSRPERQQVRFFPSQACPKFDRRWCTTDFSQDCRAVLEFLKTFADRCHHAKEEKILFPRLSELGIPVEGGPLGVMVHEHDEGRLLIRNMERALDEKHPSDFAFFAGHYVQLLRDHIAKEDNVLFAKAEGVLTSDDDEELLHRFDEIEREMGENTHERFHRMLDSLSHSYHIHA